MARIDGLTSQFIENFEFIVKNGLDAIRKKLEEVMSGFGTQFGNDISNQEWILQIFVIVSAVATLVCYGLILRVVFNICSKKSSALSMFGYIPIPEVKKLVEITQAISIRKARYNRSLNDFKDHTAVTEKGKKGETNNTQTVGGQQATTTQNPLIATQQPESKEETAAELTKADKKILHLENAK